MRAKLAETAPDAEALDGTAESLPLEAASADVVDRRAGVPLVRPRCGARGAAPGAAARRSARSRLEHARPRRPVAGWHRGAPAAVAGTGRQSARRSLAWCARAVPLFAPGEQAAFRHDLLSTAEDVCDRVASTSFVAAMSSDERTDVLDRVRGLVGERAEPFSFPYRTEVHLFPRSSEQERPG